MLARLAVPFVGLLLLASPAPLVAQHDGLERRITVPLHDGRLHADDLVRALAGAWGLAGDALPVPPIAVDVRGRSGDVVRAATRLVLGGAVDVERAAGGEALTVVVDRARARDVRRAVRGRLARWAGAVLGGDHDERGERHQRGARGARDGRGARDERGAARACVLPVPADLDPARPFVVLLHGIESSPASMRELATFLAAPPHGLQVECCDYPNDASAERVAADLAARLRELGAQRVVLVGHSLGGLVARQVVEDGALDPGNVERVVLLGTPNGGSELASLRVLREVWQVGRDATGRDANDPDGADRERARSAARALAAAFVASWRDGLGEAGGDLLPGSVFLTRCSQRERNPRVAYHAVLGTRALLTPAELASLRARVRGLLAGEAVGELVLPKVDAWLGALDELIDGEGDGAVAVAAGALPGVEPVLVPLDHRGLVRTRGWLGPTVPAAEHPVFRQVAAWIEAPPR